MAYTTQADLTERYGEAMLIDLTDRGETATGTVDADVVNRAISDADALIDGYLAGRYVLPLSVTPAIIGTISRQITIWNLYIYKPDDKIAADYKEAIRQLQQIAAGTLKLDAAGVAPATTGSAGARVTDRERPMTETSLKGFI